MLDNLRDNLMGDDSIKYIDSFPRYRTELPLAFSWVNQSGSLNPDDLYNENDSDYLVYASGVHQTAISARSVDRFGGISITLASGFASFYVQAGDTVWDPDPDFVGGPYTVSGDASSQSLYIGTHYTSTPANPEFIHIPASGEYKIVFPKPLATKALVVTHSGSAPYAISKMIPRRAVQAFDLEVNAIKAYHVSADLIEAITLEVSDSIVVGPEMIGDKTLTGAKIIDGTVSGVLITPGTVTGNLIQAGTISGVLITGGTITGDKIIASGITADKLNVTSLSAVNTNTGNLTVDGTLLVVSGEIDAGLTVIDQTGIAIGAINAALPVTNALRIYGSGSSANVNGIAFYNGAFSPTTPLFQVNLDSSNAVEFQNNQSSSALFNFNFPADSTSTALQVYNGDINLKRTADSTTDTAPSLVGRNKADTIRYQLTDTVVEGVNLKGTSTVKSPSIQTINTGGATISTFSNDVLDVGTIAYFTLNAEAVAGGQYVVRDNSNYARILASQATLSTRSSANALTFTVNTDTGATRVYGNLTVDDTITANGTLDVNANFLQGNYGFMSKNTAQTVNAGTDARITFQVSAAGGDLDDTTNNRLNITYAGLYLLTAGLVSSNVTGQTWQVVTGGAYNSGVVLNGVTQADNRAYTSKLLYLNAGGSLELWVRNSSGTNMTVSLTANGTILSIVKVG